MTQASASTTLDLPEPFGPITHVTPGSNANVVACAKDLNPFRVRLFKYNGAPSCCVTDAAPHGTRRWPQGPAAR